MRTSQYASVSGPAVGPVTQRYAWYVVFLLFLAYTLSFIDRQILTLMVDPIKRDLALSDTRFSLLHGLAFALFYTFLGLPIGRLADRADRRRIIAVGVATWSMMTVACGLARNYGQLFLARMGVGVGEGALSPAAFSMLADLFRKERLGRAISIYTIGIAVGSGLALLVGGYVIASVEQSGPIMLPLLGTLQPWQQVFILVGLPGIPVSLLILVLREPRRREVSKPSATLREVLAFILARKRLFICFLLGLSLATAMSHGVLGWAPAYFMRVHLWSPQQVGLYYGLGVLLAGSTGLLTGSWCTERWMRQARTDAPLRTAALGIGLCAPLGIAAPLCANPETALVLFTLLQFVYMMPWGVVGAAIQMVAPNEMRATLSALYLFSINIIGLGLGPTFVAALSDRVYGGQGVGYSLATAAAVLVPIATALLIAGFKSYRTAFETARAWSEPHR